MTDLSLRMTGQHANLTLPIVVAEQQSRRLEHILAAEARTTGFDMPAKSKMNQFTQHKQHANPHRSSPGLALEKSKKTHPVER